jgi:fido (protein-threonine AMPylation protein)
VLTITTDDRRARTMMDALRKLRVPHSAGTSLFFFATRDELRGNDLFAHPWRDGNGREARLS